MNTKCSTELCWAIENFVSGAEKLAAKNLRPWHRPLSLTLSTRFFNCMCSCDLKIAPGTLKTGAAGDLASQSIKPKLSAGGV